MAGRPSEPPEGPEPDEDDLIRKDIDGTTVARTEDSERFTADWDGGDIIRLVASDGDIQDRVTPRRMLNYLKRGEYYLPEPNDFQTALKRLADRDER